MLDVSFLNDEVFPGLMKGLGVSIRLIAPSAVIGLCLGVLVGALRVYGNLVLRVASDLFVVFFRGVPLVVQLFIWYFGLPHLGVYFSPFLASVVGFSLCSAAYHSEYIRGALLSIRRGQLLAAEALGFSKVRMIVSIILPQAMRRALPGCGNEIIYLIKYSSLAYMVTCIELTGEAKVIASHTFRYMEVFLATGFVYLVLVSFATSLLNWLEDRLSLPGFERHRI